MARAAKKAKIVEASGVAVSRSKGLLGKTIEQAMLAASEACAAEGITDPDLIRAAMLDAREAVKAQAAAVAE